MSILNISNQNISGNCNLKCSYAYSYHNSNTTASNAGFSINLTYDKANISPVIYNTNKYEVATISIFSPSYHKFDGSQTDAEIVIVHSPVLSGPMFIVGIPVIVSGDSTNASTILTQIITATSSNAPAQGESTNINLNNFNLNAFITPKKPLFSYTDLSGSNWIVLSKQTAISLSSTILTTLKKIIKATPTPAPEGPLVFYNPDGARKGLGGDSDQIYIDCQPVASSDEEISITKNIAKSAISFDLNNPNTILILQILISCLLFFILLFGIHYLLKYISNMNLTLPKIGRV